LTHRALLGAAALLLAACGSATMAPTPHYTTSVLSSPKSNQAQVRQIQFRPNPDERFAIADVRAHLKNLRYYDVLMLQLGP